MTLAAPLERKLIKSGRAKLCSSGLQPAHLVTENKGCLWLCFRPPLHKLLQTTCAMDGAGYFLWQISLLSGTCLATVQVLAMLGCVEEKRIVELGAGIGRFTGALAATARNVLAVDFMEHLIAENRSTHGHRYRPHVPE